MNHEEIKRYFETNPPPEVVQWKQWAKISDTQLFLNSCYTGIRNYNGPIEMCPAWWHLKDFYQHIKRNVPDNNPVAPEQKQDLQNS
ncbi:hypothetical protein [Flavobacterium tructae]|uniref:DUF6965 family protein n=1 Tax=Flavobacterium tructae TaxID=1114873 RepID=UPI0035A87E2C